jgi:hypothetical protein
MSFLFKIPPFGYFSFDLGRVHFLPRSIEINHRVYFGASIRRCFKLNPRFLK